MPDNPNFMLYIHDTTGSLDTTNDDGNTLRDLLPDFLIPNMIGYMIGYITDNDELLSILDAHDADTIQTIENTLNHIEQLTLTLTLTLTLMRLDPTRRDIFSDAILANAPDLLDDEA